METLGQAGALVAAIDSAVASAVACLADAATRTPGGVDAVLDGDQALAYDLASVASGAAAARALLDRGGLGELEASLALVYAAEVAADLRQRLTGRLAAWGLSSDPFVTTEAALGAGRDPALWSQLAGHVLASSEAGPRHLPEDLESVRQTFRRFAQDHVVPVAQQVHRDDGDVPETVISGLAALGCFALTIPEEHGGLATGSGSDLRSMVLVTEELSRASLGIAGSLITRPEIIGTAILRGGTRQQQDRWLPGIASGEKMCAVAVTEPDAGSDVAGISTTAHRVGSDWVLDGVKTWCTFAGRAQYLLVLARTEPDRALGHRGLSLFVVEKPASAGHRFRVEQDGGGSIDARAIPTIGYRGMHSFEVSFDAWRVPNEALVGEESGRGRGFYLQMQAFSSARLQTAARALGVMQAALEATVAHTTGRTTFGTNLADRGLTRATVARMAARLAACRAFSSDVAAALERDDAGAQLAASQVKQVACHGAEWVTRQAQQLHGGYGYAEEYPVSRLFVDARVLSIFEGADEVLALRVIARSLVSAATDAGASS